MGAFAPRHGDDREANGTLVTPPSEGSVTHSRHNPNMLIAFNIFCAHTRSALRMSDECREKQHVYQAE
jgi:hypothetical protein